MMRFASERGQATVELALVIPVCIVIGLLLVDSLTYAFYCTRFDVLSKQCVVAYGVSPSGNRGALGSVQQIREKLQDAMGVAVSVDVSCEYLSEEEDSLFTLTPGYVRFECSMTYVPKFMNVRIAGVSWNALTLTHEKQVVVDMGLTAIGR